MDHDNRTDLSASGSSSSEKEWHYRLDGSTIELRWSDGSIERRAFLWASDKKNRSFSPRRCTPFGTEERDETMHATDEPRYCQQGGRLVEGDLPVPADPSDYDQPIADAFIGCNRLRCAACGEWVRQERGLATATGASLAPNTLYGAADWRSLPGVVEKVQGRLYSCRCHVFVVGVYGSRHLDPADRDPIADLSLPWRCQGHPAPTLPVEVDGVSIDTATDLPALVARVLGGWVPDQAQAIHRDRPPYWLSRAYVRLERTPFRDRLSQAIGARVRDSDPLVRGGALAFYGRFPFADGMEQVVALAESDPHGAGAREEAMRGAARTTSWAPLSLLALRLRSRGRGAPSSPLDERAARLVQRILTTPGARWPECADEQQTAAQIRRRQIAALHAAAAWDGDWIVREAPTLEQMSPGRWEAIIWALENACRKELVPAAVMALLESGLLQAADLRRWVENLPRHLGPRPWLPVIRSILDEGAAEEPS